MSVDSNKNFDLRNFHPRDTGRQSRWNCVGDTHIACNKQSLISRKLEKLEQKCICSFWSSWQDKQNDGHCFARFEFLLKSFLKNPTKNLTLLLVGLAPICKRHLVKQQKFGLNISFQITPRGVIWNEIFRFENRKSTPWLFCGRLKIGKIHFPDSSQNWSTRQQESIGILWFIHVCGSDLSNFCFEKYSLESISEQPEPFLLILKVPF